MKVRMLLAVFVLALTTFLFSQEVEVPIVRDLLAPPSFFRDAATGKTIEPRKRFAAEGITLSEGESIAYDPVTSRLFVRADVETLLRLQKLLDAEMRKGSALVTLTYGILETREPLLSDEAAEKPSLVSTRVLTTDEQVEALVVRAREVQHGTVEPSSSLTAKSEETTEALIGDTLTWNVPVITADASTVEMTLTLLQAPPGAEPQVIGETRVAIPSGGSVALEEWLGEDSWRTRIITAVVVDPAGDPIPRKDMTGLPGAEEPRDLGRSLFPGPVPEPAIEKVKSIIIPSIEFHGTPLLEAIEILKKASIEHDRSLPESLRGVNIRFFYSGRSGIDQTPVTLRLGNVPLFEAIRYTAEAAACEYRIEGGTVLIGVFPPVTDHGGAEEIWFAAFLRQSEAEELAKAGSDAEAVPKRLQALTLFGALREKHPTFHPKVVEARIRSLKELLKVE